MFKKKIYERMKQNKVFFIRFMMKKNIRKYSLRSLFNVQWEEMKFINDILGLRVDMFLNVFNEINNMNRCLFFCEKKMKLRSSECFLI